MNSLALPELLLFCLGAIGFGLILLMRGGDWLIDAAVFIARRCGMSKLLIGATIVAFGTSAPELLVSLDAALKGFPDLAVGNVVGSNTGNILAILAVQAAIVGSIAVAPAVVRRDVLAAVVAAGVLAAFSFPGLITRWGGGLMVVALVAFSWSQVRYQARRGPAAPGSHVHAPGEDVAERVPEFKSIKAALAFILLGLATLVLGAKILVIGAVLVAQILGISDAVIGLTIIAIGTSLPELFAGLAAARKGHGDIAIGNILGSNFFNIFAILGIAALAVPLTISSAMQTNIFIMLAVTLAFSALLWTSGKVNRRIAYVALGLYVIYTLWLYWEAVGG